MRFAVVVATLIFQAFLLHASSETREQVIILCYHEVEETATTRYTVAREEFRRQLDLIQNSGYCVVPLADAVAYLRGEKTTISPRPVVITIDDGWLCTRTEMHDELVKRKLPFTVFIYPKIISSGAHALTWDMVREMSRTGADIQSHSTTHPFLTHSRNAEVPQERYGAWLENELNGSRQNLESRLGREVRFLAYPFGDHDDVVVSTTREAGYEGAVTTNRGPNRVGDDVFRLKRYLFHGDTTLTDLARWLSGGPM